MRVPMRGTGAERPVVAEKSGKPDGAKGSRHAASEAVLYFEVGGMGGV